MSALLEMGEHESAAVRDAEEMLSYFKLPEDLWDIYPNTFSGGERLRLNLAHAMFLAIAQILPVPVDLIRQNPAGIMPFPFPEPLCHHWQILRLVVGVKGKTLQSGPSVRHTDVQLRAEFPPSLEQWGAGTVD